MTNPDKPRQLIEFRQWIRCFGVSLIDDDDLAGKWPRREHRANRIRDDLRPVACANNCRDVGQNARGWSVDHFFVTGLLFRPGCAGEISLFPRML